MDEVCKWKITAGLSSLVAVLAFASCLFSSAPSKEPSKPVQYADQISCEELGRGGRRCVDRRFDVICYVLPNGVSCVQKNLEHDCRDVGSNYPAGNYLTINPLTIP